jgi:hypothetical protein
MVDKIKFIVDNVILDKTILEEKFYETYSSNNKKKKENEEEEEEEEENEIVTYFFRNNKTEDISEDFDSEDSDDNKYRKYLYIKYVVRKKPKKLPNVDYEIKTELIIHRNIRKDWFGEGSSKDLGFENFIEVIKKYADLFGIEEKKIWNARVTKVELGVTLKLSSKMKGILSCFESFSGITEKNLYGSNGIGFIGENFSISIYDKLSRMVDNGEIFKKSRKKNKLVEKIIKKHYFLRFELKVNKVSGFYRNDFKGRINYLKEIRDNWDYLGQGVLRLYSDINFIDILSPEIQERFRGKEKTQMNEFLKFSGIKAIGEDNFYRYFLPLMKGNGTKFREYYSETYNEHKQMAKYGYKEDFLAIMEKKIESLGFIVQ